MNRETAIRKCKQGAIAAFVQAVITALVVIIAMLIPLGALDARLEYFNDPWLFFDVAVFVICGIALFFKSRTAAIVLLIDLLLGFIVKLVETGSGGLLGTIIFGYFYVNAIRGSFTYHAIEKKENPDYKGLSKWIIYPGLFCLFLLAALIVLGTVIEIQGSPETYVVTGKEVTDKQREDLIQNDIITQQETIVYFYSEGIFSVLEGGSILTEDSVIAYEQDENEDFQAYTILLTDIKEIVLEEEGDALSDALYLVKRDEEDGIYLQLSVENGGDKKFIKALQEAVEKARK